VSTIGAESRFGCSADSGNAPRQADERRLPALAVAAPEIAGVDGDGLLTVDKITALLNADWVVLSACNTTAGADAGADAVTGRSGILYAGTRALLVTN
jgi:CHAT domain-containing protein